MALMYVTDGKDNRGHMQVGGREAIHPASSQRSIRISSRAGFERVSVVHEGALVEVSGFLLDQVLEGHPWCMREPWLCRSYSLCF